jgi:hypothetical protein
LQNILVAVLSWQWVSSPMTGSYLVPLGDTVTMLERAEETETLV